MSRASFESRKFLNSRAVPGAALRALALGVAVIGVHSSVLAIGVGRPQTLSALGQPLHLVFPVSLAPGESLSPDCVSAEVLAGDVRVPATGVMVQLEGESELKVRAVRLRSVPQIDEPLVTVSLSLGCPARLVRQYTAFIDPPGANSSLTMQAQPPVVVRSYSPQMQAALNTADARLASLLAPLQSSGDVPSLVPAEGAASAASRAGQAAAADTRPAANAVDRAASPAAPSPAASSAEFKPKPKPQPKPARRIAAANQDKPAAKAELGRPAARLQLEPAELIQAAAPAAALAAGDPASAPASSVAATDAAAERLVKLEQGMLTMQAEQRLSQQQLQTLRAELERAQSQRFLNPLTLLLSGLCLGLAAVSFQLWRSRRQERELRESAWWSDVKADARSDVEPALAQPLTSVLAPVASDTEADEGRSVVAGLDERPAQAPAAAEALISLAAKEPDDEPVTVQLLEPMAMPASIAAAPAQADVAPIRVNVEDLIDLEQQVDFFLVLGQDDAAIELLSARLDGAASDVALPYLKLLHLFQRAGREQDFSSLATRYHDRFDLPAPDWQSDMTAGAGLEDHAEVLAMLQRRWPESAASMALLQSLLVGHAEDGSLPGPLPQESLDLPTQADLLMLYGVARDKSEHEVRGEDIDLFLPLEVPGKLASTDLMATMRWQAPAGALTAPNALEVDISLDEPEDTPTRPGSFDPRG